MKIFELLFETQNANVVIFSAYGAMAPDGENEVMLAVYRGGPYSEQHVRKATATDPITRNEGLDLLKNHFDALVKRWGNKDIKYSYEFGLKKQNFNEKIGDSPGEYYFTKIQEGDSMDIAVLVYRQTAKILSFQRDKK